MRNTENNFNKTFFKDKEIHKIYGGTDSTSNLMMESQSPGKRNNFEKKDFRINKSKRNI